MDSDTRKKIKENVQAILEENFKHKAKKTILEYDDRLNFACPYCGDSDNPRKKRGNIYLDNLTFHCFNCNKHTDYLHFMKDFDQPIADINLDEVSSTIKNGQKKKRTTFNIEVFDILDEISFTRKELKQKFRLSEIPNYGNMFDYLKSRCLQNKAQNFLYNSRHNELWILNTTKTGKICGAQIRSFDPDKVKYRTYNISKLYQYAKKEMQPFDMETMNILDQTSITYNIMHVNLFENLYVFEGYIDSMFLKNSVGICGVCRNFDLVENLPETRYIFDNDNAGFTGTREKLESGKKVFMWKKFLSDLDIKENVKDFNDLIIYMLKTKTRYDFNNIEEYFTNDLLDLLKI